MSYGDDEAPTDEPAGGDDPTAPSDREVAELREELSDLQDRIDERTLHRDDVEADLRKYVRRRLRRGHARGWGPYLVLLYGTGMTLGAFYFLSGGWAILAMIVVWLSTLGLFVFMLMVGFLLQTGARAAGVAGSLRDLR
ncbi:ribonuclease BN [Haloarculaceae archaeon H-GB2-1]|nr:ribonuclease BN [Haloarculaceae archaeon H-GB1-1]MEA5389074.1 ribonuclease BN [Haloarculaceae archaeon H-GB11]MEA5407135.1 ribonuclease BN [Haloarculaceae archaeon H-GB2-1]